MNNELLPCPFCGEPIAVTYYHPRWDTTKWRWRCSGCKIQRDWYASKDAAILAANRRFVCPDKNENKVYAGDEVKYSHGNTGIVEIALVIRLLGEGGKDIGLERRLIYSEIELIKEASK